MNKALGCTILSATLLAGLALPAHGLPVTDPAPGGGTVSVAALAPAAAAALRPALAVGVRSPAVVYVQQKLGVSPVTGFFGPKTQLAVRALQRQHRLPQTGRVDRATWAVLLARPTSRPAAGRTAAPAVASPLAAARLRPALALGSRSPAVVYVQRKLGVTPASGFYGPLTRAAVLALQKQRRLPRTGAVDRATWSVLLAAKGVIALPPTAAAPPPSPAPAPPPRTTPAPALTPAQAAARRPQLRAGMGPGDPAVVYVQRFLHVSPESGFFGTLTTAAVKAYQAGLGITASGIVGPLTWSAILAGKRPVAPAAPTAPPTPAPPTIPTPSHPLPANPTAADIALNFALAQVGKPYVLGGNGPDVFDCSGLVQQAYLRAGVRLPRLASQQRFAGIQVPLAQLQPGDLLYYQDGSSPRRGHISMYAGDGLVVEAANPRRGVRVRLLHEPWYRDRFVSATRIQAPSA